MAGSIYVSESTHLRPVTSEHVEETWKQRKMVGLCTAENANGDFFTSLRSQSYEEEVMYRTACYFEVEY